MAKKITTTKRSKGKQHPARAQSFTEIANDLGRRASTHKQASITSRKLGMNLRSERYMATCDALREMAGAMRSEAKRLRTILR